MNLLVLNDHQVDRFKFYLDEAIHEGMRYGTDMYWLIRTYKSSERLKAYELANQLVERSCQVVITVSDKYNVWTRLNQYEYQIWRNYVLNNNLSLNSAQRQLKPTASQGFGLIACRHSTLAYQL